MQLAVQTRSNAWALVGWRWPVAQKRSVARDLGVDGLADHRQQVIQGQRGGLTQRHHHRFLGRAERGVEPLGTVRGIFHPLALAPFRNRVTVEMVSLGQFPVAHRLGLRL